MHCSTHQHPRVEFAVQQDGNFVAIDGVVVLAVELHLIGRTMTQANVDYDDEIAAAWNDDDVQIGSADFDFGGVALYFDYGTEGVHWLEE
jgi:hypothetical protein